MSKFLNIFFLFLLSFQAELFAQTYTWENSLSYTLASILHKTQQTSDGGYIAVGEIKVGIYKKIHIVKFDSYGDTLWSKLFDLNLNDYYMGDWIEETHDKGFIIAGSGAGPNSDAYLVKTDSVGNIVWYKSFGGNGLDQGRCVKQTIDKGYIMQCRTTSFSSNNDMLLIKTDSAGNLEWQKVFAYKNSISPAGIDLIDSSGYVLGSTIYQIGQWARVKVIKINLKGDLLWENEYDYNGMTSVAYSIIFSSKNTIVITGEVTYAYLSQVLNIDTLGNLIWQRTYSYQGFFESGRFVSESPERGYVFCSRAQNSVTGIRVGSLRLIDYDGNLIFQRVRDFGNNEVEYKSVSSTADGGFIISGHIITSNNYYGYELKTDSSGNLKPTSVFNNLVQIPEYFLHQNFPNPFNPKTNIRFQIFNTNEVTLKVFDLLGNEITTLLKEKHKAGSYSVTFDGSGFPSGVYFYRFESGGLVETRKMLIVK